MLRVMSVFKQIEMIRLSNLNTAPLEQFQNIMGENVENINNIDDHIKHSHTHLLFLLVKDTSITNCGG